MSIMNAIFGQFAAKQPATTGQQPAANQPQNPVATPASATPATPGNIPAQQQNPAAANNPTAPAATVAATAENPQPQGLDKFADIWNVPDANKPKTPDSPFAGVTPEAIQQIAGKTDFSKVVTPEMMTAISAGGEQAAAAMIQAMNAVAQQTYAQSAQAAIKLSETAITSQREQLLAELPTLIKQQSVTENLRTANPIFSNPAAAPMLNMLQKTLQEKNPTASAADIQKQAQDYLLSFAEVIKPNQPQQQSQTNKGTDFSDWLN